MNISNPKNIRIADYNYTLPDCRIAKYPLAARASSKLLVHKQGAITDAYFSSLATHLPADSLLLFNNTKVIQARMHFTKDTGASIEIFCLEPYLPNDYALNFQQTACCSWLCLVGNRRRWKEGKLSKSIRIGNINLMLSVELLEQQGDAYIIQFRWDNAAVSFADVLEAGGELPIPPYLNRPSEEQDKEAYQTVYSKIKGSVAAPTAGLHFTPSVIESLQSNSIQLADITLHVGAGTFKPVKAEQLKDHQMHGECISIPKTTLEQLLNYTGKLIAVGTTSVRSLESLYYIGELLEEENLPSLRVGQWQPYEATSNRITPKQALLNILAYLRRTNVENLLFETQIIIVPSYTFKFVDGIITNFHQPQSTLLLLVSAFVGEQEWKKIYEHALQNNYRFLSYGDSSLLLK